MEWNKWIKILQTQNKKKYVCVCRVIKLKEIIKGGKKWKGDSMS